MLPSSYKCTPQRTCTRFTLYTHEDMVFSNEGGVCRAPLWWFPIRWPGATRLTSTSYLGYSSRYIDVLVYRWIISGDVDIIYLFILFFDHRIITALPFILVCTIFKTVPVRCLMRLSHTVHWSWNTRSSVLFGDSWTVVLESNRSSGTSPPPDVMWSTLDSALPYHVILWHLLPSTRTEVICTNPRKWHVRPLLNFGYIRTAFVPNFHWAILWSDEWSTSSLVYMWSFMLRSNREKPLFVLLCLVTDHDPTSSLADRSALVKSVVSYLFPLPCVTLLRGPSQARRCDDV